MLAKLFNEKDFLLHVVRLLSIDSASSYKFDTSSLSMEYSNEFETFLSFSLTFEFVSIEL